MMKYKRLFIDKISKDFSPDLDLALGPWCFNGMFSLNKIKEFYDKGVFLENKTTNQTAAFKCCEDQHARLITKIANHVKFINKNKYSINFYEDYVTNWFSAFIHVMHYSTRLIDEYLKKFDKEYIELILHFEKEKIIFKNTHDFSVKCVNDYNFFSNLTLFLILKNKPTNWKVSYFNFNKENKNIKQNSNLKKIIVFFNKYLSSRVRYVYGLNFFEKALLSLILTFKKPVVTEQSRKDYYSKIKSKTSIIPPINDEDILNLAKELLPLSFREIYKKRASFSKCKGKIILSSATSFLVDDNEKFELFAFREQKGRIFSVQHGGNYGDLYLQRGSMEYGADKFISWGQKKIQNFDIDFQPLPSPQLKISYKKNNSEKILFVSTPNFYCYPRYVSAQSFDDSMQRINSTISFLSSLGERYMDNINYKDYSSHFSEKNILEKEFKSLNFINTLPEKNLNKSKLIVLNNYSTFLYKCLAANAPTILFFKRDCWKVNDKALKLYDDLNKAGILFYDPVLAAEKIKTIWPDVMRWWNNDEVQLARKNFCNEYANKSNKWLLIWIKFLLNQN